MMSVKDATVSERHALAHAFALLEACAALDSALDDPWSEGVPEQIRDLLRQGETTAKWFDVAGWTDPDTGARPPGAPFVEHCYPDDDEAGW